MRIKLDESLPSAARETAASLGHEVDTVAGEGLAGSDDRTVLAAAKDDGRFLITLDRGFGDIRRYPPGSHAGIAVLRLDSQDATSANEAVKNFLSNDRLGDLTGCVVVVRGALVRIRRRG